VGFSIPDAKLVALAINRIAQDHGRGTRIGYGLPTSGGLPAVGRKPTLSPTMTDRSFSRQGAFGAGGAGP